MDGGAGSPPGAGSPLGAGSPMGSPLGAGSPIGPGSPTDAPGGEEGAAVRLPLSSADASMALGLPLSPHLSPQHDPGAPADDLEEEDLFGSEDENDPVGMAGSTPVLSANRSPVAPLAGRSPVPVAVRSPVPGTGGGRSPVPSATAGRSPVGSGGAPANGAGQADDLDEGGLFGDDLDEKELFGSEEEAPDIDEKQLFGSDDEEPGATAEQAEVKETAIAPSEPSELDEREIFGDVSDDEPEKVEDVVLRRRPAPTGDREIMSLRLPNVLSVEMTGYRSDRIPATMLEGYKETKNTRNTKVVKLLNPENCVRWRFKKGQDGQILTDEDGRPQYESNSRIVEWEDGSRTLYVGSEAFNISEISDNVALFEENSQDIHVCHGVLRKRLVATPTSLLSSTHESLKRSQYRKFEPARRSLLLSAEDQMEAKQLYDMEMEQKKRQESRPKRGVGSDRDGGGPSNTTAAGGITAAFLEDQGEATGPSVMDLKRQYKPKRPRQG